MAENTPAAPAGPDSKTTPEETTLTTKPAGPDVKTDDPAGPDTATSEADSALVKSLRTENASWRTKFRESESKIAELTAKVEELAAQSSASPSTDDKAALATLKQQIQTLTKKLEQQEATAKEATDRARQKTLQAALSTIATQAQLNEPQTAIRLLQDAAVVADNDVVLFKVKDEKGKEIEVEATAENIRQYQLLPAIYFPPEGVSGTGSKGTKSTATTSVDLSKAGDFAYYKKHAEAIKAAKRQQSSQR